MSKDSSSDETEATLPAVPGEKQGAEPGSASVDTDAPPEKVKRKEPTPVPENDPLVGTEFVGKYLIKQVLGRGGMGAVYLAEHQLMRRKVAIKVLLTRMLEDDSSRKRFEHEARIASQLSHPNAVTLFDFGIEGGLPYLVMEYVEGSTLKKLLKEEGALSVSRTVALLSQLEGALSQAHRMGIVHRDLKPDNIVLTRSDTGLEVPKILDFGISKAVQSSEEAAAEDTGLTQTGMVIGTPRYLAPEQARGEKVDQRTDVYSLGIMTYEMLSGKAPFSEGTILEVIAQHLHTEAPKLSEVAKDIPPKITTVVASALAKDPKDRPESVAAYVAALREASAKSWRGLLTLALGLLLLFLLALVLYFAEVFSGEQDKGVEVGSVAEQETAPVPPALSTQEARSTAETTGSAQTQEVQTSKQEEIEEEVQEDKLRIAQEKEREAEAAKEVVEEKIEFDEEKLKIEREQAEPATSPEPSETVEAEDAAVASVPTPSPSLSSTPSVSPLPSASPSPSLSPSSSPSPTEAPKTTPVKKTSVPEQVAVPSGYYIQLEKFKTEAEAKALVQKFSGSKFTAYYELSETLGKKRYVVFVGKFESMFSAMGEAKAVSKISGIASKVTTVKQK